MKKNYQKCIKALFLMICVAFVHHSGFSAANSGVFNTPCAGTSTAASEGTFSTGYSYVFSTTGTTVNVSVTLLDTDKTGVVAYVRTQTPFSETPIGGTAPTFTSTIPAQTPGATIGIAVKFAYAGGMVVTQWINYVVGENCTGGGGDTQAPTAFTATAGTVTANSVQLLLNATDNSGNVTYTITYGTNSTTVNGASGVQQATVINNLTAGTAYTFNVTAADAAGNAAANNPIVVQATTTSGGGNPNTPCGGTATAASEGTFSTGYSYVFSTTGTTVNVSVTLLDTDKTGVVAYLRTQTPFSETPMSGTAPTFTGTIPAQTPGATIGIAVKFAYAGGMVVTQWINYVVGENCTGGGGDTQAPTGFTATAGTVTANSVQLLLNGTDDSGSVVYTITYGSSTTTVTGTSGTQLPVVINNLSADTAYSFSITAADAAGNVAANNPIVVAATTSAAPTNTACAGTANAASEGTFSTGYSYAFSTTGTTVNVSVTLLDTDKTGVVAFLRTQTPFSEVPMGGTAPTFTGTIPAQTPGATIGIAVKFAYAGGMVVTQWINYVVGENCTGGAPDTQAPTGFTATAGTVTPNSVQLLLNGTDDSGSVVYTITYGATTTTVTGNSGEQTPVVINNLTAETAYTFTVTAADAAGNAAANNPQTVTATTLANTSSVPCTGTGTVAQQGAFSTGYSYSIQTVNGNVNVTMTMLDTDKEGVVAYLWQQTPFAETPMVNVPGTLTFTGTLAGQTPGATIGFAVKFAYAGGLVVTEYISYVVGQDCEPAEDTEAPTGFTAVLGTVTANTVELVLNGTDNSGSVTYTITYGTETETVTVASGEETVVIEGLSPDTAYSFSITAADAAGNMAANNPIVVAAATLEEGGGNENTPCAGTSDVAQDGTFSTGYTYEFETVGNNVHVTITMLDTDKEGVVAFLWQQAPFAEAAMTNVAGTLTFTGTLTGQTVGNTIGIAVKFAYAGGMVVTQYISYEVGENCGNPGEEDTEAPTGVTATLGAVTATSVAFDLNATDNSGEVIYTITYAGGSVTVTGDSGVMESVVINNLSPETAYTFTITVTDAAGNTAVSTVTLNATTPEDTNTECEGVSAVAQNGTFTTGYTYHFETVGSDVVVTFELLDTDKEGVVAYVWQETPFAEIAMTQGEGLSFSATVAGLTAGQDYNFAVKFAYAGGQSVTQYFTYTVGEECELGVGRPDFDSVVKMYPNPSNGIVNFDLGTETLPKVEMFSILGAKVMEGSENTINVDSLPAGMYIVKIHSGNKTATKKLIVE